MLNSKMKKQCNNTANFGKWKKSFFAQNLRCCLDVSSFVLICKQKMCSFSTACYWVFLNKKIKFDEFYIKMENP